VVLKKNDRALLPLAADYQSTPWTLEIGFSRTQAAGSTGVAPSAILARRHQTGSTGT